MDEESLFQYTPWNNTCQGVKEAVLGREKDTEALIIKDPAYPMGDFGIGTAFQNYPELRVGKPYFYTLHQPPIGCGLPPGKGSDHRHGGSFQARE